MWKGHITAVPFLYAEREGVTYLLDNDGGKAFKTLEEVEGGND